MLSFLMPLITTFVLNPMFLLGYAVCVLFPIPFVNSFIISIWAKFGAQIVAGFKSLFSRAETTIQENAGSMISTVATSFSTATLTVPVVQTPMAIPVVTTVTASPVTAMQVVNTTPTARMAATTFSTPPARDR